MGTDYVGLEAVWATAGDIVSSGLRRPDGAVVVAATLTLLTSTVPGGCAIALYMSVDDGVTWESCTSGVAKTFVTSGADLRWKAALSGPGTATPSIAALKVEYGSGAWVTLGSSAVVGSSGAVLEFPEGLTCRRLGLRVALASGDAAKSPALTGMTLEYSTVPVMRRRWELVVRCEGTAEVPLKLADRGSDGVVGEDLSRRLWAARERGAVAFEDLDGAAYTVWLDGLVETLGKLAQTHGQQTAAAVRLVEV